MRGLGANLKGCRLSLCRMGHAWESPIETGDVPEGLADFDTIVVGGGPGGSAAAGYLALGGAKVLLLEQGVWPRDKVCGDAVGGKSPSHVAALGVKARLEATPISGSQASYFQVQIGRAHV